MQKVRKLQSVVRSLPVAAERRALCEAVRKHPAVLVVGETGCGKSTQVPQYLLEAGYRSILVTQPRRIAAASLARRVAQERLQGGGSQVAHQVRFDSTRSRNTRILFVTEGILLRLLEADLDAARFDVIVVDEVHERHLTVDLLLGILRGVIHERRPDLKLVLMSATLQRELFVDFFDLDAEAVVDVPGRCFPVETEHIQLPGEPETIRNDIVRRPKRRTEFDCEPYLQILKRLEAQTQADERGDVLVFLPGVFEIETLIAAIVEFSSRTKRWIALPLHSQLPLEQQEKVFDMAPPGVRKVVVSTNIAETSVTIDGIRFVIDSGKMKGMDVDAISSVRHLAERWVSQASAEQRKGRAGRTGPGRCYRLFSERLHGHLEAFVVPEIHRAALETPLLQVMALGFELPLFRFPESPRAEAVAMALRRLILMHAVVPLAAPEAEAQEEKTAGA
ncbi:unnamed protein product [Prorocentrum cordatum]|uniref:ATP-dependent RNA helicase n=1 Tax=Prorocentrum cordatum TaxID=2364126 RepID=A0ABN9UYL7_9DINO|nr:unnamed protein product [Polarella glacialis]